MWELKRREKRPHGGKVNNNATAAKQSVEIPKRRRIGNWRSLDRWEENALAANPSTKGEGMSEIRRKELRRPSCEAKRVVWTNQTASTNGATRRSRGGGAILLERNKTLLEKTQVRKTARKKTVFNQ